uniref:Basic tail protein n=1 Tax=Ixodes ricinus TaxID=34613 RepID=V5IBN8_IXORI
MTAAILLIVTVACLGQVTYAELKPELKRCPDKVFDDLGYSLGCTYTCNNGNPQDDTTYWGTYVDATVCVVLQDGDPKKLDHIGTCKNGTCVQYEGENIEQVWSQLPQLGAQFHQCPQKSSENPVDNCLYICEQTNYPHKTGYFYGIYQDYHRCNFNGGDGQCRSGRCIDQKIAEKYPIEN